MASSPTNAATAWSCRKVYAVDRATLYFTGYCAKPAGDPGRAALLTAGKKVLARTKS